MSRGPAPTPIPILKARGSWRGNLNPCEPTPDPGPPVSTGRLSRKARKVWDQLVQILDRMGVLATCDGNQLERYCEELVLWWKCSDWIGTHGVKYPLYSHKPHAFTKQMPGKKVEKYLVGWKVYPEVKVAQELDRSLKQIEANFGLTASARSRVRALSENAPPPPAAADASSGKARFFKMPG